MLGQLVAGHDAGVSERIHDDELDTSEPTVRSLLASQCPQWAGRPLSPVRSSGTSNAMWRVHMPAGADLVLRLPRRAQAAGSLQQELQVLRRVADSPVADVVKIPSVRHAGEPADRFPHRWLVLDWLDGRDAWAARQEQDLSLEALAVDLARLVGVISALRDLPVPERRPGSRGGPLKPLLRQLDRWWLDDPRWNAAELIDVEAVRRSAQESLDVADEPVPTGFVHGDLIPGNLLVSEGKLSAVIDWGGAGYGDLAEDLIPAWAVLDERSRQTFRKEVGASDATWLRARAFALQQAVAGVLYYVPRRHALGDVMARTLDRILTED